MYIGEVRLYNFRSYRNESIRLSPGVNVILGPNNAGKTNFLHALNLLLGESYPKRGDLDQKDFYHGPDERPSQLLGVAARLCGGIPEDLDCKDWYAQECEGPSGEPWGEDWWHELKKESASCPGSVNLAQKLSQASESGELWAYIVAELEESGAFEFGFLLRSAGGWRRLRRVRDAVRRGILTAAYLPSFRSPSDSLRITKWSWYGKLVKDAYYQYRAKCEEDFRLAENRLSKLIHEAFSEVAEEVEKLFSQSVPDVAVRFKGGPFTADEAHKAVSIFLDDGVDAPLQEKGAGLQSLLLIALFQLYSRKFHQGSTLLLLEEPENHLHPHARRVLAQSLISFCQGDQGDAENRHRQVILTTHSEDFVRLSEPESLKIVRIESEEANKTSRFWQLDSLDNSSYPRWKRVLWRNPEIVFSRHVILVEGGEVYLVPEIASKLCEEKGILDKFGVSVARVDGKNNFRAYVEMLGKLGIGWTVVADKDYLNNCRGKDKDFVTRLIGREPTNLSDEDLIESLKSAGIFVNDRGCLEDLYSQTAKRNFEKLLRGSKKDLTAMRIAEALSDGGELEELFEYTDPLVKPIERALEKVGYKRSEESGGASSEGMAGESSG